MSWVSKLFGGGSQAGPVQQPHAYQGFTITPMPEKAEHGYRIGAIIEKDGQRHEMIRADTFGDLDTAQQASVTKAQQMIDQLGMRLF